MRKLIMWNLITLDGYFEGAKNWDLPWHEQVWGEELERFSLEQLESADMLLFGRVTYEGMAAYWQTAQGKIADYMNSLPKVVCSRTLDGGRLEQYDTGKGQRRAGSGQTEATGKWEHVRLRERQSLEDSYE